MKISIFGLGYVGCVGLGCLVDKGHYVIGVDTNQTKINQINSGKPTIIEKDISELLEQNFQKKRFHATSDYNEAILNTDVSFIAVGTPSLGQEGLSMEYINQVAEQIGTALKEKSDFHVVALRSTVNPGTCQHIIDIIERVSGKKCDTDFAVVSNPEFLREGTAVYDYNNPPLTLVGTENEKAIKLMTDLYEELPGELIFCQIEVAEIMKFVNNTFHALKVSFANEIGNICHKLNIDSFQVMDILVRDKKLNISPYYLKPGYAYGGSCLPKDLDGLMALAARNFVETPVINSIAKSNELQIARSFELLRQYKMKKVSALGISFKPGTDDLRNSPYVELLERMIGKGYSIRIYDRNVHLSNLTGTNKEYIESQIPHLSEYLKEDLEEVVSFGELILIFTIDKEELESLKTIEDKILIDFSGFQEELGHKENYFGINW